MDIKEQVQEGQNQANRVSQLIWEILEELKGQKIAQVIFIETLRAEFSNSRDNTKHRAL